MKIINNMIAATLIITLMTCGTTQTGTMNDANAPSDPDRTTEPVGRNNTNPITPEISERSNGNRNLSTNNTDPMNQDPTVNQSEIDLQRTQHMYSTINMSADQIQRYERESQTWMEAWTKNNPQGVLNNQLRLQQQNITLRSILDVTQYQNYEQWIKQNPYRN